MKNSQSQFHFYHINKLHPGLGNGAGEVRLATRDEITQTEMGKGEETSLWNVIEMLTARNGVREGNVFSRVCLFTASLPSPYLDPPGLSPGSYTIQGPPGFPPLTIQEPSSHVQTCLYWPPHAGTPLKPVGKRAVG